MRNVDPVLSNKLNSQYQTKANNAQPKMNVAIARARNTVSDSSYWVVETIRQKSGLGDVSVAPRRQKVTGPPNRIYEIHVNDGVVGTSIREYPDKFKDGWVDQFDVGPGSSVAIAFDGEWERYRNLWRLVTHEKPWIFWVDNTGVLWAQLWDDAGTKQQLATGVVYCRAIRAWKNLNIADRDQGIVVGYIKTDGKVYYRNYCQMLDLSYTWEPERQVIEFTGTAESLNLFITNDYRMGFAVEDILSDIYWYITDRNWAGMAIAPEYIQASVSGSIDMIYITKIPTYNTEYIQASVGGDVLLLYAMADNDFRMAENFSIEMLDEEEQPYNNWGFRIRVRMEHDMTSLDYSDFTLIDSNSTAFAVTGITKSGFKEYEFETADFNNAVGDLTLSFATGNTKGEAGQAMDSFDTTFTPTNLAPTSIPLPEVEVIWNE
jgi:hypothetical protein